MKLSPTELEDTLHKDIRVTPLVFLPSADARTKIVKHFNVALALGPMNLSQALRSVLGSQDGGWHGFNYRTLPQQLGLTPMRLSFLMGWIASSTTHQGVGHLQVIAEVDGEQQITSTDARGYYSLCVRLGSSVTIGYVVPGQYESPQIIELKADQRFCQAPDVYLLPRTPLRKEADIREEVREEMFQRLEEQHLRTEAAWNSTRAQVHLIVDDLNQQLYQLQVQLNERERQLRVYQQSAEPTPLPARVLQQSQTLALEEQRTEITAALEQLNHSNNTQLDVTFQQSLTLISRLKGELRQPLPSAAPTIVQVQSEERPDPFDVAVEPMEAQVDGPALHNAETIPSEALPNKRRWFLPAAAALLLIGVLGTWSTLHGRTAPAQIAGPVSSEQASDRISQATTAVDHQEDGATEGTSDLPGTRWQVPASADTAPVQGATQVPTTQGSDALPGEPVH